MTGSSGVEVELKTLTEGQNDINELKSEVTQKSVFKRVIIPWILMFVIQFAYTGQNYTVDTWPVPEYSLLSVSCIASTIFLFFFSKFTVKEEQPKMQPYDHFLMLCCGLALTIGAQMLLFLGIRNLTNLASVGAMMPGITIFVYVLSVIFRLERIKNNIKKTIGLFITLLGIILAMTQTIDLNSGTLGLIYLVGDTFCFALHIVLGAILSQRGFDSRYIAYMINLHALPFLLIITFATEGIQFQMDYLPSILYNAIVMFSIVTVLYIFVVSIMPGGAPIVSLSILIQPLSNALVDVINGRAVFSLLFIIANILMAFGMIYAVLSSMNDKTVVNES
ncbi:hypothetical protein PCE1_002369 [Barthelona sp. PCE]